MTRSPGRFGKACGPAEPDKDADAGAAGRNQTRETRLLAAVRENWGWSGIEPVAIIGENPFGHLILRDRHGRFWRLSPEALECSIIADSEAGFAELANGLEFLADWRMQPLVDTALAAVGELPDDMRFDLVTPAAHGGPYTATNMRRVDAVDQIRVSGAAAHRGRSMFGGRLRCRCGRC